MLICRRGTERKLGESRFRKKECFPLKPFLRTSLLEPVLWCSHTGSEEKVGAFRPTNHLLRFRFGKKKQDQTGKPCARNFSERSAERIHVYAHMGDAYVSAMTAMVRARSKPVYSSFFPFISQTFIRIITFLLLRPVRSPSPLSTNCVHIRPKSIWGKR